MTARKNPSDREILKSAGYTDRQVDDPAVLRRALVNQSKALVRAEHDLKRSYLQALALQYEVAGYKTLAVVRGINLELTKRAFKHYWDRLLWSASKGWAGTPPDRVKRPAGDNISDALATARAMRKVEAQARTRGKLLE